MNKVTAVDVSFCQTDVDYNKVKAAVMTDVNWIAVGSASLLAGVLSVLTSVAGLPEVSEEE